MHLALPNCKPQVESRAGWLSHSYVIEQNSQCEARWSFLVKNRCRIIKYYLASEVCNKQMVYSWAQGKAIQKRNLHGMSAKSLAICFLGYCSASMTGMRVVIPSVSYSINYFFLLFWVFSTGRCGCSCQDLCKAPVAQLLTVCRCILDVHLYLPLNMGKGRTSILSLPVVAAIPCSWDLLWAANQPPNKDVNIYY